MRLLEMLNQQQSKRQRDQIVCYIGSNQTRFTHLVKVFVGGPYRITQRAAWPLSYCAAQHPALARPHLRTLIDAAQQSNIHDAVKRNVVRLLQFVDIPKRLHGKAINLCLRFLTNTKEPVAVRVFAMTVLANLAEQHPAIANEVIPLIEKQLPFASAGFQNRGGKVLRKLKSLPSPTDY